MDIHTGPLDHLGVLAVAGPDALAFLQGQVSNDTRRLAAGGSVLAAYSTPQGRVICVMHLLPHEGGALAILPRELVPPVLQRLKKFVLRSKVDLRDASAEFAVAGARVADAPPSPLPAGIARWPVRSGSDRHWLVGSAERLAGGAPGAERTWRLADIRDGMPQVYPVNSEMFVAQMLNLDLIDGISFKKGCFTGQEIIARTQHLGRIKRRMHRLALPPGEWTIGQSILLADGRCGRLTEVATDGAAVEVLAVIAESGEGVPVAAEELPLPYSLTAAA
jgi:folate-binding protein YgfZ